MTRIESIAMSVVAIATAVGMAVARSPIVAESGHSTRGEPWTIDCSPPELSENSGKPLS